MEGVSQQPHAVMFPYPAQGHINPMMQLAKRLLADGFFITFVNTDHNHQRMFRNGTSNDLLKVPNLRFEHLPDGLPASHGRFNENVIEVTAAILALPGPFAKLVKKIMGGSVPPVTCIITDSFCSWMQEVADQFSLPRVSLWTTPVHANLAYHFQSTLISEGYVPLKDKGKAASVITCIPGVAPMKLEDYVSFFLEEDSTNFLFQWHLRLCMRRPNEAAWNLGNNFAELESEAVAAFKKEVPNFLPIGPLLPETILKGQGCLSGGGAAGPSLWPEEGCEEWLAHHDKASVLYISFGSLVNMCEDELADLIRGLEESKIPFLWAVRPDQGGAALSQLRRKLDAEAVAGTASRRALLVSWAPQLAVLTHPSVGAFLTHCGWNSLVESLSAGVPILAKPGGFAEQRMNAHYVANVWQVGLRMPPSASAAVVKSQICSMLGKTPAASAFRARLGALRKAAVAALSSPSGSSYSNYRLFVEDMQRRAGSC